MDERMSTQEKNERGNHPRRYLMIRRTITVLALLAAFTVSPLFAAEEEIPIEDKVAQAIEKLTAEDLMYLGPRGRKAAMEFLVKNPQAAAGPLLDALEKKKDSHARLWMLLCVNSFEDLSVFETGAARIIALLDDASFGTKYWAIKILAKMKLAAAVKPLMEFLSSDDHLLRSGAAAALGQIGGEAPVEELIKLLADSEPLVRRAAAKALGELAALNAKAPLIKTLENQEEDLVVRRVAVEALEKITETSFNIEPREWSPVASERETKIKDWIENNK